MAASSWCGFAVLGSGLILCAVAAGADPPIAVPLVAVALAEFVWGGIALRSGRVPAPRAVPVAGAGVVVAATALLFAGVVGAIPVLALLALHWSLAVLAVRAIRRGREDRVGRHDEARRGAAAPHRSRVRAWADRPTSLVLILAAQAMLVAAITTPALAHTAPGESALPHGSMHGTHAH